VLCLVTDRRRYADASDGLLRQIATAIDAGIDLIHIRERDLDAARLFALASAAVHLTRGTSTRVVINDRLDIALASGAHGVHLRGDSFAAADARRMAPRRFLIGRSVHAAGDAATAGDVDYVIAGTVFPTSSKPDRSSWLGVEGLRAIVSASRVPVLAIGGVTRDRIADVAAAGAAGVAAIGLFSAADVREAIAEARAVFDSAKTAF